MKIVTKYMYKGSSSYNRNALCPQLLQISIHSIFRNKRVLRKYIVVLGDILFLAGEPFSEDGHQVGFNIKVFLSVVLNYVECKLFQFRITKILVITRWRN